MIKGVTHAHLRPIWYHSKPSDAPYSPNQLLGWDFFAAFYNKMALVSFVSSERIERKSKTQNPIHSQYSVAIFGFAKTHCCSLGAQILHRKSPRNSQDLTTF